VMLEPRHLEVVRVQELSDRGLGQTHAPRANPPRVGWRRIVVGGLTTIAGRSRPGVTRVKSA
jgi:hypothetical protein